MSARCAVRFLGAVWLVASFATGFPAQAADEPEKPLTVLPNRHGYAHDNLPLLLRQRLFGTAHALIMLSTACSKIPAHAVAVEAAYADWHRRQADSVDAVVQDLYLHYFGPRSGEARWQDLVRALQLKDSIQPSLRDVKLEDACATLPEALTRPRYDFAKLLAAPPELIPNKPAGAAVAPPQPEAAVPTGTAPAVVPQPAPVEANAAAKETKESSDVKVMPVSAADRVEVSPAPALGATE
jgi:hypothetical protein